MVWRDLKKFFGTRNPYDNRYGANIVRSGPKNSGYSEAIVITENIVVSGIVIARLYCMMNVFAMTTLLEGGMGYQRVFHR